MATPVITGIKSPSMEIGETMWRSSKSPKWLVPSLPFVGESYFAMCCMKMSRGRTPLTSSAPMLRIIGASQSFFSSAYAVPTEIASWPRLERSEEHTSELQSLTNLVCRLLLEKKKKKKKKQMKHRKNKEQNRKRQADTDNMIM